MTPFEEAVEDARAWMRLQPGKVRYARVDNEPERVMLRENVADEYLEFWPMRDPRLDSFECVPVLRQASAVMNERAGVVRFLQTCEQVTTLESLLKAQPNYSPDVGRVVIVGIQLMLQYARGAIERGDHLR